MEVYYDAQASLDILRGKTLGVIGYGNQGRAQALNLRDSGLGVIVGAIRDESAGRAETDGFEVLPIVAVVERADLLALLIPDEVQRQVYHDVICEKLCAGQTLSFAHGYNIHFGLIVPPKTVDIVMIAPRMIGAMVRESYEHGSGSSAFVAVHQDATGHAMETALAFAHGIGATRAGVFKTTFGQETELDLFQEQGLWPLLVRTMVTAYEFLVAQGFPPEMVALEMYGSGEAAEIFREMARVGFFKQMRLHSQTSQYGTLSRALNIPFQRGLQSFMDHALSAIRDGTFVEEWRREQEQGYPLLKKLRTQAEEHPLNGAESTMRELLKHVDKRAGLV